MQHTIFTHTHLAAIFLFVFAALASVCANAGSVNPVNDDEVIEVLPAVSGDRAEIRKLRRALAAHPNDALSAVKLSQLYLDQARTQGDPRFVGQALALLGAWPQSDTAPDDVLLMLATLQQFLHDFDTSASNLERLLEHNPKHAQAWLTLATVRRVQGRYADSERACKGVAAAGAAAYAGACQAENASLRGDFVGARAALNTLLGDTRLQAPSMRNWLLTTLAESEARAGRNTQAEAAYRQALQAAADGYTSLSFADFLMTQNRFADASRQLQNQPRTDAVLLRLAIAGVKTRSKAATADVDELRERMALALLRPEARTTHAREYAMFALWIDNQPREALELAKENVRHQREPLDVLLLAQAATASQDAAARRDAASLASEMGLRDVRLDALR
jgi:Tfp pilus assembly protein PilF